MPLHAAKPNLEDVGGKPMTSRQPDEGVTRKRRRDGKLHKERASPARIGGGFAPLAHPSLIEGLLTLKRKREDEKNAANEDRAEGNQFF